MAAAAGIEQVVGDHRIEGRALGVYARPAQHENVVFQILADLLDGRVFEDRTQGGERFPQVQMRLVLRPTDRQIPRFAVVPREGKAHQFGKTRADIGGFGIEGKTFLRLQLGEKIFE